MVKSTFVLVNTILLAGLAAVLLNAVQRSCIGQAGSYITVIMCTIGKLELTFAAVSKLNHLYTHEQFFKQCSDLSCLLYSQLPAFTALQQRDMIPYAHAGCTLVFKPALHYYLRSWCHK